MSQIILQAESMIVRIKILFYGDPYIATTLSYQLAIEMDYL